ncbi:MAG: hypothetical protein E6J20_12615 [Chloroflexi bacterium]|nr:MAG: hypothetical protein E6J20_12615 [Chloroflexota bacterium]
MARNDDLRRAKSLLLKIPHARSEQRQRLLMAAAVTTLMRRTPIVVGGTAEAYWAGGAYHPTDLDLCPMPNASDVAALRAVGLSKQGRHWTRDDLPVAVEFPGAGDDIERSVQVVVDGVAVRIIAREDLYLDRVRQATAGWPHEDLSFDSAFGIALTNYQKMDWMLVRDRITAITKHKPSVGETMHRVNRRVRARARRRAIEALARPRQ